MKAAILLLLFLAPACRAQGIDEAIDLYLHGKFQPAAEVLSGLIRQNPADKNLAVWSGKALLKLRRWDDAVAQFKRAVDLDPNDGMSHLWLGRAYGRKAEHSLIGLGPARMTRAEFETAARLAPDNVEIRFDLMEFYLEAPGFLGGGKDKAQTQAREIARVSPRQGYAAQADIYEDAKDWTRARESREQAVQKFPQDADARLDLAQLLLRTGDLPGAEEHAARAVALDKENRAARVLLAAVRVEQRKDVAGALKVLQGLAAGPLTDKDPGFEEVYYWIGRAYLAQDKKADARRALEASLGFDPDYGPAKTALKQTR